MKAMNARKLLHLHAARHALSRPRTGAGSTRTSGRHDASGFAAGVAHPLHGLDHILAMVAVGLWAAQLGGRARWLVPASFVSVMALGGALGMAGIPMPFAEQGIFASVLILGVLIAASGAACRWPRA